MSPKHAHTSVQMIRLAHASFCLLPHSSLNKCLLSNMHCRVSCSHILLVVLGPACCLAQLRSVKINAVRLPLSAPILTWKSPGFTSNFRCGEYNGWKALDILDDVVRRLRESGIFVMFDIHTLDHPEANDPLWCQWEPCNQDSEKLIFDAWKILAQRYCASPNVILADGTRESPRARHHALSSLLLPHMQPCSISHNSKAMAPVS